MRKQILISLVLALTLLMAIAGSVSYWVALHEADEIFSARLATSARVLETLLARQVEDATLEKPLVIVLPHALNETESDDSTPLGHPYETKLAFQVWHADGKLLVRSEYAPAVSFAPLKEGFSETTSNQRSWHVFTLRSREVWIQVAEETGLRAEIASKVGVFVSSPLLVVFGLLFLLVNLIVTIGFRPLQRLALAIDKRNPEDNSPVVLDSTPVELRPLVQALNVLFGKMGQMLSRERRFTDSAAHELRTPLAALSLHAENAVSARTEDERAISLARLMTGLNRTKHLVEQMLTYSRINSDTHGNPLVKLDLVEELKYLVSTQTAVLEGTGLQIRVDLPEQAAWVNARRGLLEILLRNLLDNACKYTSDPQDAVVLTLQQTSSSGLVLSVTNASLPIDPVLMNRLFEPYYRLPNARQKGNGLGLAMAREIALLHGWHLELKQTFAEARIEAILKFC